MSEEFELGLVRCKCKWCGDLFWAKRSTSQFCSAAHKQKLYRWRKNLSKLNAEGVTLIDTVASYLEYGQSLPTALAVLKRLQTRIKEQLVAHKVKDVH